MSKLSQSIPWDPSRFVGFTDEQLELIRKGFFAALDEVYRKETQCICGITAMADVPCRMHENGNRSRA